MNCQNLLGKIILFVFFISGTPMLRVGADSYTAPNDRTAASEIQPAYSDLFCLDTLHQFAFEALKTSYPDLDLKYEQGKLLINDGSQFVFDDGRLKNARQLLDDPDIFDMFVYAYPIGGVRISEVDTQINESNLKLPSRIPYLEDPGRVRVQEFFNQIYGKSETEVKQRLVPVRWVSSGGKSFLLITNKNGVAQALQRVSDELNMNPALWPYLLSPGGSFNWRCIAGTDRLSVHSYGAAVDINVACSDYWHDQITDEDAKVAYRNRIPAEIIEIFEKNGFIWGGWWYHFDTMHFEYRPELLEYTRLVASALQKRP